MAFIAAAAFAFGITGGARQGEIRWQGCDLVGWNCGCVSLNTSGGTNEVGCPAILDKEGHRIVPQVSRIGQVLDHEGHRDLGRVHAGPAGDLHVQGLKDLSNDHDGPHLLHDDGGLARPEEVQVKVRLDQIEGHFNGIITNDKFCLTRWAELELSWWRRSLRLRDGLD